VETLAVAELKLRGSLSVAMHELAIERIWVIGPLALYPFKIGQARAVGKFIEHPCRHDISGCQNLGHGKDS